MLNITRNGYLLVYPPSKPAFLAQLQRRLISRNTGINRGLRQEASGGRKQKPWEKDWEHREWQGPPRTRRGKMAPYAKRWQGRQQANRESPDSHEKQLFQREWAGSRVLGLHGDGESKSENKPYQRDQSDRGSPRFYRQGEERRGQSHSFPRKPWEGSKEGSQQDRREDSRSWEIRENKPRTQHREGTAWQDRSDEPRPWEIKPYQRDQNKRRTSQPANRYEDAPLGFNRPAVGRDQNEGRQLKSKSTFRREHQEPTHAAESGPISVPYTTAASEFLYGYNAVRAAVKAHRRKLYKIYIHPRAASREDDDGYVLQSLRALAANARIVVQDVDEKWLRVMDKMSDQRPHNGVVLEASPLPRLPVTSLGPVEKSANGEEGFRLTLGPQSAEELVINGNGSWQPFKSQGWRSPLVLLIDDVTNPGNLGAIIRSAYFLGVDAIALSTRTCAPLNADTVKASAGSMEAIPIFKIEDVGDFLEKSMADQGRPWDIYAATTPRQDGRPEDSRHQYQQGALLFTSRNGQVSKRIMAVDTGSVFDSPLGVDRPVILAIGGEQKGLDYRIIRRAMAFVQILPTERIVDVGVDSLNVGAASAILCAEFMTRKPK